MPHRSILSDLLPHPTGMTAARLRYAGRTRRDFVRCSRGLKITKLEKKYRHHDEAIAAILSAIRELMHPPTLRRRGMGFTADLGESK